jgi:hypothetical protein
MFFFRFNDGSCFLVWFLSAVCLREWGHKAQIRDGLHTPALTTLGRATSLCRSVVSSTTPSSMAPPTPSLLPFTFLGDVIRSSSGEEATYPFSTTTMEAHSTQATSSSCMPASWPTCFLSTYPNLRFCQLVWRGVTDTA